MCWYATPWRLSHVTQSDRCQACAHRVDLLAFGICVCWIEPQAQCPQTAELIAVFRVAHTRFFGQDFSPRKLDVSGSPLQSIFVQLDLHLIHSYQVPLRRSCDVVQMTGVDRALKERSHHALDPRARIAAISYHVVGIRHERPNAVLIKPAVLTIGESERSPSFNTSVSLGSKRHNERSTQRWSDLTTDGQRMLQQALRPPEHGNDGVVRGPWACGLRPSH